MATDGEVFVFDHISAVIQDLERARALYDACLAPLGLVRLWTAPHAVGDGPPGYAAEAPLAIVLAGPDAKPPDRGSHLAFAAPESRSRERTDRPAHRSRREGSSSPRIDVVCKGVRSIAPRDRIV